MVSLGVQEWVANGTEQSAFDLSNRFAQHAPEEDRKILYTM